MAHFPTAEQIAIAWLNTVPGVPVGKVATTLPADQSTWSADGFLTVASVGGSPHSIYVPIWSPIIQVDAWANNVGSAKPPWGKAGSLIGKVMYQSYLDNQPGVFPILDGYNSVRLLSVFPISEPRRITGDDAGFARYQLDMAFKYAVIVPA